MKIGDILFTFSKAIPAGLQAYGWRGAYIAACIYLIKRYPFQITLPDFGPLRLYAEIENVMDNIVLGQLRDPEIEAAVTAAPEPVIVDVGVNVGMTIRWWRHLNARAKVVGVDMMQESLDYTASVLSATSADAWTPVCAALGSGASGEIEVAVDDPLSGETNIYARAGKEHRKVRTATLDSVVLKALPPGATIDLLKIDIEGAGGEALSAATETLRRTRYVVVETHSRSECMASSRALSAAGLFAYRAYGRMLWYSRVP